MQNDYALRLLKADKVPLVVLENICWAFNSYEGMFQLQTVYLDNMPFVAPFRMDCIGAIDTIPMAAFTQIKNEVVARLYGPSETSAGASAAAIATSSAAAASAASSGSADAAASLGPTAGSAIAGEGSTRRRIVMNCPGFASATRSGASLRKGAGKGKRKAPATQRYEYSDSDVDEADLAGAAGCSSSSSSEGGAAGSSSGDGYEC